MATEVNLPTENTAGRPVTRTSGDNAQQFWNKNSKVIMIAVVALALVIGGIAAYQAFVKGPNEQKAADAMWKAEEFYRMDSARLALNGDGASLGFVKIISRYGGTKSGNLAKFYAASSYMKLGDFNNAVKYLKDFSTDDKLIQVRAAGLLGDAYAELGNKNEAVANYKKAGTLYPDDNFNSPEYLFRAGLLFQDLGKNADAIEMYQIIKDKYAASQRGREIEKYLARLGVTE